jgi:uncharacterized protein (TIGR02271 family)
METRSRRDRVSRRVDSGPIVVLPVVEEQARIATRPMETGKVRVRKIVRTRIARLKVALRRDEFIVDRVPIDRLVSAVPTPRHDGDILVIPVVEEVLIKGLRLVEEIRIRKRRNVEHRDIKTPLRREEIFVERHRGSLTRDRNNHRRS